jgi:hypothetical protein
MATAQATPSEEVARFAHLARQRRLEEALRAPSPSPTEHVDYDSVGNPTPRVGWPTTSKTKPIMIDALAQTFRERRGWRNAALIGEARTYVVKDNGDTAASGNLHDDRVMCYAIAEMLRRHEPAHQEVVSLHEELDALMNEGEWERLAGAFGGHVDSRY